MNSTRLHFGETTRLGRLIPVITWARQYTRAWLSQDIVAGITSAAVVIPKAMAYATIAYLPVEAGLYTALVPLVIYAIFGSSPILSVSTTTTIAIITQAELSLISPQRSPDELITAATTLAVLTGIVLILGACLRLGFLANFISEPVLVGFKTGIGILIVVDQLPKLLGIHIDKGSVLHNLSQTISHLNEAIIAAVILGVATLGIIFALERFLPRTPAPLIAVASGIAATLFGLRDLGVETLGTVPWGMPHFTAPQLSLVEVLWPGALAIALMSYTESVAAMRAFARVDEPHPDSNHELLALGLANVGAGLFGGMPAGGGTTQTAVNRRCGARTQLASFATAGVCLAGLLVLAPVIGLMPQATLAAIVIAYSIELIKTKEFRIIKRIRSIEFWWAIIAVVGIILFGTIKGILVAVIASLASLVQQANNPPVYAVGRKLGTDDYVPLGGDESGCESIRDLLVVRVEGRIYFANAERVVEKLQKLIAYYHAGTLILDCRGIVDLEFSALNILTQAEINFRALGIELWIAAPNPHLMDLLQRAPLGKTLGTERIFQRLHPAVEYYKLIRLSAS